MIEFDQSREAWMKHCGDVARSAVEMMPIVDALEVYLVELGRHSLTRNHSALAFANTNPDQLTTKAGFLGWVDGNQ